MFLQFIFENNLRVFFSDDLIGFCAEYKWPWATFGWETFIPYFYLAGVVSLFKWLLDLYLTSIGCI